ncbi:hypothetical protein HHI36_012152 [Cryptolaemus montrouzieri]|uniref:Protein SMG7 n=1 Tax=Cryptolaemus montrouzieri TaxID=559131 RepID=A0ABD2NDI0_9CUCU
MGYNNSAVQILQQAEDLKLKVLAKHDLLNESQAWTDQQKLQTVYHQALILDLEYALDKKVEQDLWNVGFKNHINALQELVRDKKNPQRSECQALLNWCLESASGFYISLLQEFCNTFDIDLPFRRQGKVYGQIKEAVTSDQLIAPQSSSCLYICQYCLVHLGDIARYRNQRKQAESFYKQAIQVSPNSGHPYNQLALLEASLGDKLSTVFYYVRGIAVKNPFPAATTNLMSTLNSTMDKERPLEKFQTKMTANEFIQLFLCTHGYLYTLTELNQACAIAKNLGTIMTALVATESFTEDKLIKMTVINLYALQHISGNGKETLTMDEEKVRTLILDLLASSLSAFLVPVYTLKADENLMDYYALPAVKIIFHWIQDSPTILTENVFMKRLQIWPSFCKLLNNIQPFLKDFKYKDYSTLPLAEDRNLKGFLPLSKYLKQFEFSKEEDDLKVHKLVRIKRILDFGIWLTTHEVNGTKLVTKSEYEGFLKFEPGCIQPDPTNDLLEEIKSFSIDNKFQSDLKKGTEKKAGILKPQGSLEKSREERELLSAGENAPLDSFASTHANNNSKLEAAKMKRAKQNVALQSIFKKMEENKQVKFTVEEKGKDKLVKFESKPLVTTPKPNPVNNSSQFGSSVRTQSFNQNHSAFPSVSNQQQDYLTTLRNMANNYGMGTNYPMQNMYGGMQGGMQGGMPAGWGAQGAGKANFNPLNMGQATFNHMQASGFDTNSPGNWWNNQGNNMMTPGGGGGFNNFNSPPFGGGMMGGAKMVGGNQASGDSFNSPWTYGAMGGGGFDQGGNMSMRQQMLKEANNMPANRPNRTAPPPSNNETISYCRCHE